MTEAIQTGDTFRTELGETMEITNERGDEVCVHFPERDAPDGGAYTAWRPRSSVEAQVEYEDMERVGDDSDDEEAVHVEGEFVDTPRCPVCSRFMSTGFDGNGLPGAQCSREGCHGALDDRELIEGGHFEEA